MTQITPAARLFDLSGQVALVTGASSGLGRRFARVLAARAPNHAEFPRYPTAATTVMDFQVSDWSQVSFGRGSILDFFVPSGRD